MSKRIVFVSQSGNVMKSTLATAMAVEATINDLDCAIADLDIEHRTSSQLSEQRSSLGITPTLKVYGVSSAKQAIDCFNDEALQIIDAPSRATSATTVISKNADLIIQPVPPSKKDMDLAIESFYKLSDAGIDVNKMLFVFTRVGSQAELKSAINYLSQVQINNQKINILTSAIWEKVAYRGAINDGYLITETQYATLNGNAKAVIHQILTLLLK